MVEVRHSAIIVNLLGLTPNSRDLRIESFYQLRWPILISSALLAWATVYFAIRFRRRTGESLALWLKRFDVSLSGNWRPAVVTPKSRVDAVIELDWRRILDGGLVGIIGLVFVFAATVRVNGRSNCVRRVAFCRCGGPLRDAFFFLLGYTSYDQTKNGGFRWTMPESDTELAYVDWCRIFCCADYLGGRRYWHRHPLLWPLGTGVSSVG